MASDELRIRAILDLSGFNSSLKILNSGLAAIGNAIKEIGVGALRFVGELAVRAFVQAGRAALNFARDIASAAFENNALQGTLDSIYQSLIDVTRVTFTPLVNEINRVTTAAAPAFLGVVQRAEEYLSGLATDALGYGENVASQFAQGIWDGFVYVVDALTGLGDLITYWLSPGSPPRILPDLDQWGADALEVYLGGWANGDFSVFNKVSSTLTSLIRSMADPLGTGEGIIPQILGTRAGLAKAVEELRQTGSIATGTLDDIIKGVGGADTEVRGYLESLIALQAANADVAAAQAAVNDATRAYDALLKPIDAQLASISEAQQQFTEDQEKGRLALTLKDPNATASEKRQAQLRLEQIDAERARRAAIVAGNAAVDSAQDQLTAAQAVQSAAQDSFDAETARLAVLAETNGLINDQIKLLDKLNDTIKEAVGAKGAGGKGGGGIKPDTTWIDEMVEKVNKKLEELKLTWQTTWETIKTYFAPFVAFLKEQWERATLTIFGNIQDGLDELKKWWDKHHAEVKGALLLAWEVLVTTVTVSLTLLSGAFKAGMQILNGDWAGAWETTKTTSSSAMDQILAVADTDWETFRKQWQANADMWEIISTNAAGRVGFAIAAGLKAAWAATIGSWLEDVEATVNSALGILSRLAGGLNNSDYWNSPYNPNLPGGHGPSITLPPSSNGHSTSVTNNTGSTQHVTVNSSQSAPSIIQDLAVANVWAQ